VTPAAALLLLELSTADAQPVARPVERPELVIPVLHSYVLMGLMRAGESYLYPDPFSKPMYFGDHYKEAFTKPPIFDPHKPAFQWDGDPVVINVVGHGLFGSELYLRARQCHFGVIGSLAFSAATSAVWEYAFEGNGVRPSVQDLIWTPFAGGLLLGEGRYQVFRLASRIDAPVLREVVKSVMDPFGEIERAIGASC
jgi:hypothetical protein